jgi:hypothetical protein
MKRWWVYVMHNPTCQKHAHVSWPAYRLIAPQDTQDAAEERAARILKIADCVNRVWVVEEEE